MKKETAAMPLQTTAPSGMNGPADAPHTPVATLECCVDSTASALAAQKGGATRLELCSNLVIGGTTPTPALLAQIKKRVSLPVFPLIRPRFGDFLYTEEEFQVIYDDVKLLLQYGADGMVIGALNPDGTLCTEQLTRLMDLCKGRPVTLHRAFDMCRDPWEALAAARALGFASILTSGQKNSCLEGLSLLQKLSSQAGNAITIMAGSGVNAEAIRIMKEQTALRAFHMSGKKALESSMAYRNPSVSMGTASLNEYEFWQTDEEEIRRAARALELPSIS